MSPDQSLVTGGGSDHVQRSTGLKADVMTAERGFGMVDVLMTVTLIGILAGVTIPGMLSAVRGYELRAAIRGVTAQAHAARLRAVTSRRTMRVRFDCPAAGQFRVVEVVVNNPGINNAGNRCDGTAFPFPNPNPPPDFDGPVLFLPQNATFAVWQDLDFGPTGRMTPVTGGLPATIQITNDAGTQTITVSAAGRVQAP